MCMDLQLAIPGVLTRSTEVIMALSLFSRQKIGSPAYWAREEPLTGPGDGNAVIWVLRGRLCSGSHFQYAIGEVGIAGVAEW